MKKVITSILCPPMSVCRFGCGTNCAAPISVFWIAGVVAVIYAFFGGPTAMNGIDFYTLGLGLAVWLIAAVWALLTMSGVEADRCNGIFSPLNGKVAASEDERDPLEEVRRAH
ncbi:MAG: hypothetical protein P8Z78_00040 [Gammaproteobacteria bacterium]|jgi:hypothetical protein